jgi:hypothetical protein
MTLNWHVVIQTWHGQQGHAELGMSRNTLLTLLLVHVFGAQMNEQFLRTQYHRCFARVRISNLCYWRAVLKQYSCTHH